MRPSAAVVLSVIALQQGCDRLLQQRFHFVIHVVHAMVQVSLSGIPYKCMVSCRYPNDAWLRMCACSAAWYQKHISKALTCSVPCALQDLSMCCAVCDL